MWLGGWPLPDARVDSDKRVSVVEGCATGVAPETPGRPGHARRWVRGRFVDPGSTPGGSKSKSSFMATTLRQCEKCGKEFAAENKEINRGLGRFCSRSCGANVGRPAGKSESALRQRARNIWIGRHRGALPICVICYRKADVHHKDGNPENNAEDNHEPLCRSHHVIHENRIQPKRARRTSSPGSSTKTLEKMER